MPREADIGPRGLGRRLWAQALVFGIAALGTSPATGQSPLETPPPRQPQLPTQAQPQPRTQPQPQAQPQPQTELIAAAEHAQRLGKYDFAIPAFKQAYRSTPRPELLVAIATAYRRRFALTRSPQDRLQSILHYQAYLAAEPLGPASEPSRRALGELENLEASADVGPGGTGAAETVTTWLSIRSSVMGAVVRIDGKKPQRLPLFVPIEPGTRALAVSAPGYRTDARKVRAAEGGVYAVKAELAAEPAQLTVTGTGGAEVLVDGRFIGITPMEEPTAMTPGSRRVTVLLNGYLPHSERVALSPGASEQLEVDLTMTQRRVGASTMLALGGAGVVTGLVFGVASLVADGSAPDDRDTPEAEQEAQRALALGDDYRAVSGIAAGVGLGLSLCGAALFTFDEPELSVQPAGPGLGGATMRLRF